MVELEAGQVWGSSLAPELSQVELLTVGKTFVSYQHPALKAGVNVRTIADMHAWITRHGARLVTDDGAGGEG